MFNYNNISALFIFANKDKKRILRKNSPVKNLIFLLIFMSASKSIFAQNLESTYVWPIERQIEEGRNYYRELIRLFCAQLILDSEYKIHSREYDGYKNINTEANMYRITVYDSLLDRKYNITLLQFKKSTSAVIIITDTERPSMQITFGNNGIATSGKGVNNIDPNDPLNSIKKLREDGYAKKIEYILELARKQMLKNI